MTRLVAECPPRTPEASGSCCAVIWFAYCGLFVAQVAVARVLVGLLLPSIEIDPPQVSMARRGLCLLAAGAQQACSTRVPVVRHDALLHANGTLRLDTSVDVPRFDPGPEALAYMREQASE